MAQPLRHRPVQIDVDDKFSLKNSQVELLAPLHDTPSSCCSPKAASTARTTASRPPWAWACAVSTTATCSAPIAFGLRPVPPTRPSGPGVEYWRDFLKVNANSYTRLTGWKDSPDVEDYRERPANGWDLRTEAWLPSMPQLGGKLSYEQYYGDEVGLFGKDNRKKDPSAVTVGLTYTPIPLLTLSADQRKGNGGNETTVGAEFSYQIGEPWAKQVDPPASAPCAPWLAAVTTGRTQQPHRPRVPQEAGHPMAAAAHVSGQGGETKSLSVWVNSKYPLSHIDWTAPALLQAGGRLVHDGGPTTACCCPTTKPSKPTSTPSMAWPWTAKATAPGAARPA